MERQTFAILFFAKKTLKLKNGESPILCRITVDSIQQEIRVQRSVKAEDWNQIAQKSIAKGSKAKELNDYLDAVRVRLLQIHRQLELDGVEITSLLIKEIYLGKKGKPKMLIEEYHAFVQKCRELIGKSYSEITVKRYERNARYLVEFMQKEHGISDIPFKQIDNKFIMDFIHYLKTEKGCGPNGIIKPYKNFKKVVHIALLNKWITEDPFVGIKVTEQETDPNFLMKYELDKLIAQRFDVKRLEQVRDIFVFCCFTGLAYTDVNTLDSSHIIKDNHGNFWIRKRRVKTKVLFNVPLMEIPLAILKKYENDAYCQSKGKLLPVKSCQNMNGYLKEIAQISGIDKELNTHCARHTFATLALTFGTSMDSVSKMLGHKKKDMTKLYARVLDDKITKEMENFRKSYGDIDYNALHCQ